MIKCLRLNNVGPSKNMEIGFSPRLNIITGDNGLGKSFILDISWWALTGTWPGEINPKITSGQIANAFDSDAQELPGISYSFTDCSPESFSHANYSYKSQTWDRDYNYRSSFSPALVLYAMADGSFAVWDQFRNVQQKRDTYNRTEPHISKLPAAYVFSPTEVWNGLKGEAGNWLCNGLIQDWAGWQKEGNQPFLRLAKALHALSPSMEEKISPGKLTRVSLDDVRDIPTIRMHSQHDVPIIHASSAVKRVMALAYFLVWAWEEHCLAAKLIKSQPVSQVTFLIDEIESHLHPKWQRVIVKAVMDVMKAVRFEPSSKQTDLDQASVQLITTTHAPLIMASLEPFFDDAQDAWFDLDLEDLNVVLRRRDFEKQGDTDNWLTSEAFDLPSAYSVETSELLKAASDLLNDESATPGDVEMTYKKLIDALNPKDSFLFSWRYTAQKKGLLR